MWKFDKARVIKEKHKDYINTVTNPISLGMMKIHYNILHPLTVLDSYPDVTAVQGKKLKREVEKIYKKI